MRPADSSPTYLSPRVRRIATRALAIDDILSRILAHLPQSDLQACFLVSRDWCSATAPFLFSHLVLNSSLENNNWTIRLPWPIRPYDERGVALSDLQGVEWAYGEAIDSVRQVTVHPHSHGQCDPFKYAFPVSNRAIRRAAAAGSSSVLDMDGDRYNRVEDWRLNMVGISRQMQDGIAIDTLRIVWDHRHCTVVPCNFMPFFNPSTIELIRCTTLASGGRACIPFGSRTKKLVFKLVPVTDAPGVCPIYAETPAAVQDIVVHLSTFDELGLQGYKAWDRGKTWFADWGKEWGDWMSKPDPPRGMWTVQKVAGHWANMVLNLGSRYSLIADDGKKDALQERRSRMSRRFTFVGCERLDREWVGVSQGAAVSEAFKVTLRSEMDRRLSDKRRAWYARHGRGQVVEYEMLRDETLDDWHGRLFFLPLAAPDRPHAQ